MGANINRHPMQNKNYAPTSGPVMCIIGRALLGQTHTNPVYNEKVLQHLHGGTMNGVFRYWCKMCSGTSKPYEKSGETL